MAKKQWTNNASNKLSYTYKITPEDYELLEKLTEITGWTKNRVLDSALYDFAEKLEKIERLWDENKSI